MEELDLKELISMFLEKKLLIVLVVIIFALMGAIYTLKFVTPIYQSTTSLVLAQIGGDNSEESNSITSSDIALNTNLIDNYRVIAKSKSVAQEVIDNLNLDTTVEILRNRISVTTESDSEVIKITVLDEDPELACKITTEVAEIFMGKVETIYKVNNITVLDKAEMETTPSNINLTKNIVIFAFVGGILIAGYILLINMLDTTVKTDTDIEKALDIPVLASIVLTDDATKKKFKAHMKREDFTSKTASEPDEDDNIQVLYEHNSIVRNNRPTGEDEAVSMFTYMGNTEPDEDEEEEQFEGKSRLERKRRPNRKRKNNRREDK